MVYNLVKFIKVFFYFAFDKNTSQQLRFHVETINKTVYEK